MPEILVRGHAAAMLPPSDAALTVTVHVRAAGSQADAVAECARRCEVVDAAVAARRDALVRRAVTSSIRTGPEWDHSAKGGRRLIGHFATRTTELDCAPDGDGLTDLLTAVSGLPDVQVTGPRWTVAPGAEGWDAVRATAAADARRRAQAYARGLELTVGRVVWLAEPGLRLAGQPGGGGGEMPMAFAAAPAMRRSGGGGEEEETAVVRIQPEPIAVEVRVEAAFDLS
ncbi:MAG TPA: SIMPL domain-containing protein [Euzebya sp.]|nr:SIMPL domain-containing protein [Euzebya sp.]